MAFIMQDNIVEVSDVHFAFGDLKVLQGVDLTIPRGKVVAVLGASGVGKSTLLRLLGAQAKPSRGSIRIMGEEIGKLNTKALYELRKKIGMMLQLGGLFSDMTVFENIAFPMREHTDLPEALIRDLVLMKLHAVGLRGARSLMPTELSGGMSRRVALARAIALDPALVMYDEPFAGLDPISLNVIASLIRRLNDALGLTSIIVTYDVGESMKVVDYVYFISEGRVVAQGPTEEIRHSQDPFVRQFLDAKPDGPVAFHYPGRPIGETLLHPRAA